MKTARIAAIVAIPILGITLLSVVWWTVVSIRSASDTTMRGEADTLHSGIAREIFVRDADPATLDDRVEAALEVHASDGVRYLALIDAEGNVLAEAGAHRGDPAELSTWAFTAPPEIPQRVGDRARVVYRRDARAPRKSGRPPRPAMVVEFAPRVADDLESTARWLLLFGAIAALTLTGLAAVLVRWSLGRERTVRAFEQARRLATLGQVSAVLAHEIRNPLASLKGNAQLLAMQLPAGEKVRAKADRVVTEATRLETLSNDLLEFARDGELRAVDADPVAIAREAADAVARDRIDIEADGAPRAWPVDPEKLRRVLINLLDNAAALDAGRIELELGRDGRALAITVRDRGPGISEADLPQVFEPFFTRREQGTGLGLAVARRLVELHGGSIAAVNAPGGGAEFRIRLPRGLG